MIMYAYLIRQIKEIHGAFNKFPDIFYKYLKLL